MDLTASAVAADLSEHGVDVRDIQLPSGGFTYAEQGDPGAPLVVLSHGFPDYPRTFFPIMTKLARAGYRCVAPYLRGYAPSTTEGPFHGARLGDDLAEFIRALSPHVPAILVGHDWGAVATYAAAARSPHLIRRAVTLAVPHVAAFQRALRKNTVQRRQSAYMAFLMLPLVPERIVPRDDFAFIESLWRRWSPRYTPTADYLRKLKICLRASMPAPLGHYRALRSLPLVSRRRTPSATATATGIRVPLLHLHGAEDGCIAPSASAGEERYFTGEFRSESLSHLGHFLHLEAPDLVATKILDFIGPPVPR